MKTRDQLSFQKLSCTRNAAARAGHENLPGEGLRADREKTIGSSRPPSPCENRRADNLATRVRDRSWRTESKSLNVKGYNRNTLTLFNYFNLLTNHLVSFRNCNTPGHS